MKCTGRGSWSCDVWLISVICRNRMKIDKSAITPSFFNLMTWKAQVRCKVTKTTLQYLIFFWHWQFAVVFGENGSKSLSFHCFSLNLMTSLRRCLWLYCHELFFTNLSWYGLTPCENVLRLNVIFMVRKIGQLLKIFKILIVSSFSQYLMTSQWRCLLLYCHEFFLELTFVLSYSMPKFV